MIDFTETTKLLETFDFKNLFIEHLGWNRWNRSLEIRGKKLRPLTLECIAEKCGMGVFRHHYPNTERSRNDIEQSLKDYCHENLIIFTNDCGLQVWRNKGIEVNSDAGFQDIRMICNWIQIKMEEEQDLTISKVSQKVNWIFKEITDPSEF